VVGQLNNPHRKKARKKYHIYYMIAQYSRICHHTNTTGLTFSVPTTEDFTTGTWDTTHLALSEIGVDELNKEVYIRIADEIKKFTFADYIESGCCDEIADILRRISDNIKPTYVDRVEIVKEIQYVEIRTTNYVYVPTCEKKPVPRPPQVVTLPPTKIPVVPNEIIKGWIPVGHIMEVVLRNGKKTTIGPGYYWRKIDARTYGFVKSREAIDKVVRMDGFPVLLSNTMYSNELDKVFYPKKEKQKINKERVFNWVRTIR
jgi:hypothetical protein